ncbi:MAG: hypothetical protein NXH97_00025 [Rhodobacteraceae bacterium]|nr:hypothetical protein [Paracoccaceae bacterium]
MSLQLWTLTELGGPILAVLLMQAVMTVAFTLPIFFRVMGSNYQGGVLSAGFTLVARPTAISSMPSVTKRYGSVLLAFIVPPLVSAFFWISPMRSSSRSLSASR